MEVRMTQQPIATFELLHIDSIVLDLKNPRIAKWLEIYEGVPSPEQIELALRSGGGSHITTNKSKTPGRFFDLEKIYLITQGFL
jgi:hypothetical protein